MKNHVFDIDLEWVMDGMTIHPLSVTMRCEESERIVHLIPHTYQEGVRVAERLNGFAWWNVVPHVIGTRSDIVGATVFTHTPHETRDAILDFVGESPIFWAYVANRDKTVLDLLIGDLHNAPKGWRYTAMDLSLLVSLTGKTKEEILPRDRVPGNKHCGYDDVVYQHALRRAIASGVAVNAYENSHVLAALLKHKPR